MTVVVMTILPIKAVISNEKAFERGKPRWHP
jgi:hypothetical protein